LTSPTNLGSAINECCKFVAQTFTAGRTGVLTGVNVDVQGFGSSRLRVAIRTVEDGLPTALVLTETALDSSSSSLSELITFPQQVQVVSGTEYAIVVSYDGAPPPGPGQGQGGWAGATGNAYPSGALLFSVDGVSWSGEPGFDAHFRTYVMGAAEQLDDLLTAVTRVGPGTSLADKLHEVQSAPANGDNAGACGGIKAFANQVKAQSGKSISEEQASAWAAAAERIRAVLSC
jgi:hypothetical protein